MKILIGSSAPPDGGAGISSFARSLAESLVNMGHEVHYVSPAPRDRQWLDRNAIGHIVTNQDLDAVESAGRLLDYCKTHSIEGVINNDNPFVQSIAPALSIPLLVVCHMDRYVVGSLCTLHKDYVDHLICISNDMQRTMVSRYGFPVTRCSVVHNGLIDPGHDGVFTQRGSRLRLVFCGGWNRNKGSKRVLEGLLRAPDTWERIRVDWFGHVPDKARRRALRIPGIEFHGHVSHQELRANMAEADALLFASRREGCPMSILEAMSLAVIPISSDGTGAMRWLFDSGREGFICQLRDYPAQMADCIRHLSANPRQVEAMKRSARERYLRDFQGHANAEKLLALLAQPTIDRSRPPQRFDVIQWHRPLPPAGKRNSLSRRLGYRLGRLRVAGQLDSGH